MRKIIFLIASLSLIASGAAHAQIYTVNSAKDPMPRPAANDNAKNDNECTFAEALGNVNYGIDLYEDCIGEDDAMSANPEIRFKGVTTITMFNGDLSKSDEWFSVSGMVKWLKIKGPVTFDGIKRTRILFYGGDTTLEIEDVNFVNGVSDYEPGGVVSGSGGCILVNGGNGGLILNNVKMTNCIARNGGAIEMGGAYMELRRFKAMSNKAIGDGSDTSGGGGAISGCGVDNLVVNSTFMLNEATNIAGAWLCADPGAQIDIVSSRFLSNKATPVPSGVGGGGALVLAASTAITASKFDGNMSDYPGGAILNLSNAPELFIGKSVFLNNVSVGVLGRGGAIASGADVFLTQSLFEGNRAKGTGPTPGGGGAIFHTAGTLSLSNSTAFGNKAEGGQAGAAVHVVNGAHFELIHNTMTNNAGNGLLFVEEPAVGSVMANNILTHNGDVCVGKFGFTQMLSNIEFPADSCPDVDVVDPQLTGPHIYKDVESGLPPKWLTGIGMRHFVPTSRQAIAVLPHLPSCHNPPVEKQDQYGRARSQCRIGAIE